MDIREFPEASESENSIAGIKHDQAKPLTAIQSAVFNFIVMSISENGFPPSIREISNNFSWSSDNSAASHLKRLVDKGCISISRGKYRSIKILQMPKI